MVDVNIKTKSKLEYIEIVVDAYPYPVNYKGQYHIRSGATKQELRGASLDKFILQKQGKHWDSVPHPLLNLRDLSKPAIQYFKKKAIDSGRITADDLRIIWKCYYGSYNLKLMRIIIKMPLCYFFIPIQKCFYRERLSKSDFFK
nr:hypothetical protein [Bacteroidota bacterium]